MHTWLCDEVLSLEQLEDEELEPDEPLEGLPDELPEPLSSPHPVAKNTARVRTVVTTVARTNMGIS